MPSKAITYGVAVLSILIILGGFVGWTLVNSKQASTVEPSTTTNPNASQNPKNSPAAAAPVDALPSDNSTDVTTLPVASSPEQIRDATMRYLQVNHPETSPLISDFSWAGGNQSSGTVNIESFVYNSSGWVVAIQFSDDVNPNPVYSITANYDSGMIFWNGTFEDGAIAETTFSVGNLVSLLSTQEQIRDSAMTFIETNHAQTAPLMTSLEWTGQKEDTGPVGPEKYDYSSGGWTATIQYPIAPSSTYIVTIGYSGDASVSWTATYQNGTITETNYAANIPTPTPASTQTPIPTPTVVPTLSPTPSPTATLKPTPTPTKIPTPTPTPPPLGPEQVRTLAINFIRTNHPATVQYMPTQAWTIVSGVPPTYVYTNNGWNVTMVYSPTPIATYNITAIYASVSGHPAIQWRGIWQSSTSIIEQGFTFTP